MDLDPRYVIDYGKYVGPGKNSGSIGAWVAYLAVFASLSEADYGGMMEGGSGYQLRSGIIAKLRGSFQHPVMGWVPVFDFEAPEVSKKEYYWMERQRNNDEVIAIYEARQGQFLKALMCGEFAALTL